MKKFFGNPWVIGIGTTVAATILLKLSDWIFNTAILLTIWGGVKIALAWFFAAKLKVWIVLLIVVMVFWLSSIYWESRISLKKPSEASPEPLPPRPKHTEYDGDIFETILWKWKWEFDKESNLYVPSKFTAYCPKCTCHLVPHESGGYDCPNCRKIYPYRDRDQEDQRLALIIHNINIDSYPSTGHKVPPGYSKL